ITSNQHQEIAIWIEKMAAADKRVTPARFLRDGTVRQSLNKKLPVQHIPGLVNRAQTAKSVRDALAKGKSSVGREQLSGLDEIIMMRIEEQKAQDPENQYIRLAERYGPKGENELIICFLKHQAQCLLQANRLAIDDTYSGAAGYIEWEAAVMYRGNRMCVGTAFHRGAQDEDAMFRLLSTFFNLVKEVTGNAVIFSWMTGYQTEGINLVLEDFNSPGGGALDRYWRSLLMDYVEPPFQLADGDTWPLGRFQTLKHGHALCYRHGTVNLHPYANSLQTNPEAIKFWNECLSDLERLELSSRTLLREPWMAGIFIQPQSLYTYITKFREITDRSQWRMWLYISERMPDNNFQNWFRNKQSNPWFWESSVACLTRIPLQLWKHEDRTTNIVETVHDRNYTEFGKNLALAAAVQQRKKYQQDIRETDNISENTGVIRQGPSAGSQTAAFRNKATRHQNLATHTASSKMTEVEKSKVEVDVLTVIKFLRLHKKNTESTVQLMSRGNAPEHFKENVEDIKIKLNWLKQCLTKWNTFEKRLRNMRQLTSTTYSEQSAMVEHRKLFSELFMSSPSNIY
ncbi:hypothetical protein BT69DRAFT_1306583, partial [Atractiella rhizophila]